MFLNFIYSFLITICFSILFQVEKKQLVFCGITGGLGWTCYYLLTNINIQDFIATLFSSILVTFLSRLFANLRKDTITLFLTTGIIPLVPGSKMYYTMLNIISHNNNDAYVYGIETLKIAGSISLGIILVLSLPNKIFNLKS